MPSGATSGPIAVSGSNGSATSAASFTVNAPVQGPSIDGFTPTAGAPNDAVTINGKHLAQISSVKFNGTSAQFWVVSPEHLTTMVPAGATSGPIAVSGANGSAMSATAFTVKPPVTHRTRARARMRGTPTGPVSPGPVIGPADNCDGQTPTSSTVRLVSGQSSPPLAYTVTIVDLTTCVPEPGTVTISLRSSNAPAGFSYSMTPANPIATCGPTVPPGCGDYSLTLMTRGDRDVYSSPGTYQFAIHSDCAVPSGTCQSADIGGITLKIPVPSLTLAAGGGSASLKVRAGEPAVFAIAAQRGDYLGPIDFAVMAAGTPALPPEAITPPQSIERGTAPDGTDTVYLTVATVQPEPGVAGTSAGSYSFDVTPKLPAAAMAKTKPLRVTAVVEILPDVELRFLQTSPVLVAAGQTAKLTMQVFRYNFTDPLQFTASGGPPGATFHVGSEGAAKKLPSGSGTRSSVPIDVVVPADASKGTTTLTVATDFVRVVDGKMKPVHREVSLDLRVPNPDVDVQLDPNQPALKVAAGQKLTVKLVLVRKNVNDALQLVLSTPDMIPYPLLATFDPPVIDVPANATTASFDVTPAADLMLPPGEKSHDYQIAVSYKYGTSTFDITVLPAGTVLPQLKIIGFAGATLARNGTIAVDFDYQTTGYDGPVEFFLTPIMPPDLSPIDPTFVPSATVMAVSGVTGKFRIQFTATDTTPLGDYRFKIEGRDPSPQPAPLQSAVKVFVVHVVAKAKKPVLTASALGPKKLGHDAPIQIDIDYVVDDYTGSITWSLVPTGATKSLAPLSPVLSPTGPIAIVGPNEMHEYLDLTATPATPPGVYTFDAVATPDAGQTLKDGKVPLSITVVGAPTIELSTNTLEKAVAGTPAVFSVIIRRTNAAGVPVQIVVKQPGALPPPKSYTMSDEGPPPYPAQSTVMLTIATAANAPAGNYDFDIEAVDPVNGTLLAPGPRLRVQVVAPKPPARR